MIEIRYMLSNSGLDNCFEFIFPPEDYIPDIDGEFESRYTWSAYQYYTWLFKKYNLFKGSPEGRLVVWSRHWDCEIKGMPFKMFYDEDYDLITFAVEEEYISKRECIAEALKALIEDTEGSY